MGLEEAAGLVGRQRAGVAGLAADGGEVGGVSAPLHAAEKRASGRGPAHPDWADSPDSPPGRLAAVVPMTGRDAALIGVAGLGEGGEGGGVVFLAPAGQGVETGRLETFGRRGLDRAAGLRAVGARGNMARRRRGAVAQAARRRAASAAAPNR